MAATPEGAVKKRVREVLDARPTVWSWMPVTNGMGKPGLDFVCAVQFKSHALFFAIETKAPGKKPTMRQEKTIRDMRAVGITVFVVDGDESLKEVTDWLDGVEAMNNGARC